MAHKGTGMPMSQDATHAPQLPSPFADSFSADAHHLTGRPRSASSQLTPDVATSWGPSPTISTLCPLPSNPSSTDPEPPFSRSIKRPSHEPNDSTDYNSEVQDHLEGVTDGERETNARLTSRYVDPEDHPAYEELQTRIHQSHNDQDRWAACMRFHERYKILKEPLGKLGEEIEERKRQLEEAEASRGDKESNLDALVLLGTSFMQLECQRFSQVQQSYNEVRHKRPRNSDYPEQRDLQVSGQEWSDFFDNHTKASRDLQKCEKVLGYVGKRWGDDKIRYYGWATKTWATCRVLQSAAKAVPTWEEAGIKLNKLRNYRDRSMGTPITHGKRSISWKDLDNLRLWKGYGEFEMPSPPVRKKRGEDSGEDRILRYARLATGEFNGERLGFDKFGILVLKDSKFDEGPITLSAPPWGMAKSAEVGQEAEEQMGDTESLLGDQDEGCRNDVQDKATPITSIRGSARLAARQPPFYTNQCAPLKKPVSHRTRLRPDTDNHVVGDEEYGLALPAHENRRRRPKSSMADAITQTDRMPGEELNLEKARDLSSSSQGAELDRYCTDFQDSEEFKRRAVEELNEVGDKSCWGAESSRSCSHYLFRSCCPAIALGHGQVDAHFSTLDEAKELVDRMTPDVPIFTRCSNAGAWKPNLRPIVDYLTQMKTVPTKKRYVQKYSLDMKGESFTKVTQWALTSHFVREDCGANGLDLWNALELENHLEQRHVPEFLTNSNCNLLVDIGERAKEKTRVKKGRKGKKVEELPEKDPLHFALIADGGMNTYPHTDSHGYSTFLTVQEGELIFGWLSRPDDDTWNGWARNPRYYEGGRWCFVVMKPGDCVYLPSGTPHYVVRRKGTQTFILGGHVLQWSNLHGWASLLRRQIDNPTTTNEHMASETVRRYVEVAGGLVAEAMKSGDDRLEYLGGIEAAKQTRQVLKDLQEMIENKKTQTET
ncbi:JmjC domain-containing protein [Fusarium keratoplasticum]|uniref:JmjC domain-containing protein n=1 Tax=Fusarium keratoplasticum TaxID=1328300 RepID=A0ACC0RCD2_9HYPO|nr:JmjC domain-containing protein [Fusarium keratoplasticum]KAI8680448.1 JmjC domain-containing protein [Fusarium keratoplasticum]